MVKVTSKIKFAWDSAIFLLVRNLVGWVIITWLLNHDCVLNLSTLALPISLDDKARPVTGNKQSRQNPICDKYAVGRERNYPGNTSHLAILGRDCNQGWELRLYVHPTTSQRATSSPTTRLRLADNPINSLAIDGDYVVARNIHCALSYPRVSKRTIDPPNRNARDPETLGPTTGITRILIQPSYVLEGLPPYKHSSP